MLKTLGTHNYFVYLTTNKNKTVLYVGVTGNLRKRIFEHKQDSETDKKHFAGKYNAYRLVYWERYQYIEHAIKREKQIKGWLRQKKEDLIEELNPNWKFLNDDINF